jgi:transposase-like protein
MTKPIARDPIYRRRVFDADIIQLCVRCYITYRLSYRDLVELMAERGIPVAHSTILRWVNRYVPEYEKRWDRFSRPVGTCGIWPSRRAKVWDEIIWLALWPQMHQNLNLRLLTSRTMTAAAGVGWAGSG